MSVEHAFAAAEAGRVDGDERLAVHFVADVDRVAGRAGHFAHDHPFGLGERVHKRALARVAAADDGHLHHAIFRRRVVGLFGRQLFQHGLDQLIHAAFFLRAGGEHLAAHAVELVGLTVQSGMIGLVGHADHGHLHISQPLVHLAVQRHHALAGIDDEEDHRGRIDGRVDLLLDLLGEVVDVLDAHSAGIDQFDEPLAELDEVRLAVACHPGGGVDDGQTLPREPVEEARFAHVGPADDGDLRNTHDLPILVEKHPMDQSGEAHGAVITEC